MALEGIGNAPGTSTTPLCEDADATQLKLHVLQALDLTIA